MGTHQAVPDPFTGTFITDSVSKRAYAAALAGLPKPVAMPDPPGECVFCPEHAPLYEKEIFRIGSPDHWDAIVIRNAYPFDTGQHDLVVCSPQHSWAPHTSTVEHLRRLCELRRLHGSNILAATGHSWLSTWLSYGVAAGASQPHAHIQLLSFASMLPRVADELSAVGSEPTCGLCLSTHTELLSNEFGKLILSAPGATLVASGPDHGGWSAEAEAHTLAAALRLMLTVHGPCAYNITWHTEPAFPGHPHLHVSVRGQPPPAATFLEGWTQLPGTWDDHRQAWLEALG